MGGCNFVEIPRRNRQRARLAESVEKLENVRTRDTRLCMELAVFFNDGLCKGGGSFSDRFRRETLQALTSARSPFNNASGSGGQPRM
jgi:hypothetical protein